MSTATTCAIYVRRSAATSRRAVTEGETATDAASLAVGNRSLVEQEDECRDLADRHGLVVVEVYREKEGTGASPRSRRRRPEWERALADLEAGDRFQTLVVWALDRASRGGADTIARLLTEHASTGRRILGVDGTDTRDERSRLATIVRAEFAREESERIAARVTRTKRRRRDAGFWLGGRPPYGLAVHDGRLVPDPERFETARSIADALMDGQTLWSVVDDLNERGIPSSSGGRWRVPSLSALVRSPAWAGLQSIPRRTPAKNYTVPDVYRNADGATVTIGTGVVTPAERALILARLAERTETRKGKSATPAGRERTIRGGVKARASVLGDLIRCAECGGRASLSGRADRPSYRCANRAQGNGRCAGFTAPQAAVDEHVFQRLVSRLGALEVDDPLLWEVASRLAAEADRGSLADRRSAEAELALAEADVDRLLGLASTGVITSDEAARLLPPARERREAARADRDALAPPEPDVSALLDALSVEEFWDSLDVDGWRRMARSAIESVVITRASGRGVRFAPPERVQIAWRPAAAAVRSGDDHQIYFRGRHRRAAQGA